MPSPAPSPGERPGPAIGAAGERLAAAHLERLGFTVIERNARFAGGEIDLIACDGRTLLFVEVKTAVRRTPSSAPLARLGTAQCRRLRRVAVRWLAERTNRPRAAVIRFDAIGVLLDAGGRLVALEHLEGAF